MTPHPSGVTDVGDAPTSPAVDDTGHTTVEHAILGADGRVHLGPGGLRDGRQHHEHARQVADLQADVPFCGGAPHVINTRQRTVTVTVWEPVQTGDGAA